MSYFNVRFHKIISMNINKGKECGRWVVGVEDNWGQPLNYSNSTLLLLQMGKLRVEEIK